MAWIYAIWYRLGSIEIDTSTDIGAGKDTRHNKFVKADYRDKPIIFLIVYGKTVHAVTLHVPYPHNILYT